MYESASGVIRENAKNYFNFNGLVERSGTWHMTC